MSTLNPVNAWDMKLAAVSETSFGTTPTPASEAAYKARLLECISANLGPAAQVGVIRPKQDRGAGRGMQDGWVEGRVQPIDWAVQLSVKSRSANDGAPLELALYKAGGLNCQDAGSTYTLTPSATPIESAHFAGLSLQRWLGSGSALYSSEVLRGCVARTLKWEGGDKELMLSASGVGVGKYAPGNVVITFADGSTGTGTISAADSKRIDLGYYLIESEIILVTAFTRGGTSITATRAQLSTSGAAHSSAEAYPYRPSLSSAFTGAPIPESTSSVDLGGVSGVRCINWSFELQTGMDLLPGETGSRVIQGPKSVRYSAAYKLRLVLSQQQLSMIGDANNRTTTAVSISQGSGTGGVFTFASSYTEIENFEVPDDNGDVAIVDVGLRVRDSATGNDAFTITGTGS